MVAPTQPTVITEALERNWQLVAEAERAAEAHAADYWGAYSYELVFYVIHDHNGTWLMLDVVALRSEKRRDRYRYDVLSQRPVMALPHARHELSVCRDCTRDVRRWMGLGDDVQDLEDMPGADLTAPKAVA